VTQAQRVAENDALFREANEGIRAMADREQPPMTTIPFLCECPREDCRELAPMPLDQYESIRSHPTYFINAPGHEASEGPHVTIVEHADGYVVVDKVGPLRDIVIEDWERAEHR
jgi:hypothetical protein